MDRSGGHTSNCTVSPICLPSAVTFEPFFFVLQGIKEVYPFSKPVSIRYLFCFWLDDKVSMSIPSVYPALHSFWSSWDNVSH
ncbi:unnamed protein product [Acanthoscelides obtectus]|uniref:Uncharacterized protein n=1 Tax=Acanthoscelides obtectus TaxID=200917 RepID=A0A9P0L1F1_ACAOB|nr:unnamed protein product [Acanthoscelides obtectus]CAK1650665.1 hypothetical protein AOBTE_LOCUS16855 [Acanthoscelides obtectus]